MEVGGAGRPVNSTYTTKSTIEKLYRTQLNFPRKLILENTLICNFVIFCIELYISQKFRVSTRTRYVHCAWCDNPPLSILLSLLCIKTFRPRTVTYFRFYESCSSVEIPLKTKANFWMGISQHCFFNVEVLPCCLR